MAPKIQVLSAMLTVPPSRNKSQLNKGNVFHCCSNAWHQRGVTNFVEQHSLAYRPNVRCRRRNAVLHPKQERIHTIIAVVMSRNEVFKDVQGKCLALATGSMESVFTPILDQLKYLIALDSGESVDRSMIQNIDIGLRALRNLEDIYPELAKELYDIQRKADRMAEENGLKNRLAP